MKESKNRPFSASFLFPHLYSPVSAPSPQNSTRRAGWGVTSLFHTPLFKSASLHTFPSISLGPPLQPHTQKHFDCLKDGEGKGFCVLEEGKRGREGGKQRKRNGLGNGHRFRERIRKEEYLYALRNLVRFLEGVVVRGRKLEWDG